MPIDSNQGDILSSTTPEHLFKFCDPDSAKLILSSQRLRWSSPHIFEDPFELTHQTQLNFEPKILLQASIKMATAMIFAKDAPKGNTPLAQVIRRWRDEERFASPEEADSVLRDLLSKMVDQRLGIIEQMMTDWRKFARSLRICCFTSKVDNLNAWQRLGGTHKGVAIRFQTGEFTTLPNPRKVQYQDARPEITKLKDEISMILGTGKYVAQDLFEEKFVHKGMHCSNEQEWRCFQSIKDDPAGPLKPDDILYDDFHFERSEVTGVYFGANTSTQTKKEVLTLVKENYSQAKLFQGKVIPGKFELEFERMSSR